MLLRGAGPGGGLHVLRQALGALSTLRGAVAAASRSYTTHHGGLSDEDRVYTNLYGRRVPRLHAMIRPSAGLGSRSAEALGQKQPPAPRHAAGKRSWAHLGPAGSALPSGLVVELAGTGPGCCRSSCPSQPKRGPLSSVRCAWPQPCATADRPPPAAVRRRHDPFLQGALRRGDWYKTADIIAKGPE